MDQNILDRSFEEEKLSSNFVLRTKSVVRAETFLFIHAAFLIGSLLIILWFRDYFMLNLSLVEDDIEGLCALVLIYILIPATYAFSWKMKSTAIDKRKQKESAETSIGLIMLIPT